MFLTAQTFRQATWAPPSYTQNSATNFTSAVTQQGVAVGLPLGSSRTSQGGTTILMSSIMGMPTWAVYTSVNSITAFTSGNATGSSIVTTGGHTSTIVYSITNYSVATIIVTSAYNLFGSSTTSSTASSFTNITLWPNGASTTASTTVNTSTTGSNTSFIPFGTRTTMSTTVTSATTVTVSDVITTASTNITRTIWSIVSFQKVSTTTTGTSETTATATRTNNPVTTATTSTAIPSWWGWSSDVGTLILATGNSTTDDLPAWIDASAATSLAVGLWNYSFTTQTTLWNYSPSGTTGPTSTLAISAVSPSTISTYTQQTNTTITIFGTFTNSTTGAGVVAVFTDPIDVRPSTAGLPLATVAQGITSYSTATATIAVPWPTPANTTLGTTGLGANTGGIPSMSSKVTVGGIGTSFTLSTRGTVNTTFTVTALTAGHMTASFALGLGNQFAIPQVISTTLLTAASLAFTTATASTTFIRDWSCPTCLSGASTTTSSSAVGTIASSSSKSVTTSVTSYSEGFTQQLFSAPIGLTNYITILTGAGSAQTALALPNVATWCAAPSMQVFAAWSAPSVSYQNLNAPGIASAIGAGVMPLLPFTSGRIQSQDANGAPIYSTAWGVWALAPYPHVTSSTFTSTSSPGIGTTDTITLTNSYFDFYSFPITFVSVYGTGGTTVTFDYEANFPDLAGTGVTFSFAFTSAYTSTAAGPVTVTLTSTGATSGVGDFTFTNSVTSTFMESYALTIPTTITVTRSTLQGGAFINTTTTSSITFVSSLYNSAGDLPTASRAGAPTYQYFPGPGGTPKITGQAATIIAISAGVSLFGFGSTSWSSADTNLMSIVIGGTAGVSSSTTSNVGAGTFNCFTFPGQASIITSPALFATTTQNQSVRAHTAKTQFWNTVNPVLIPNTGDVLRG